MVSIADKNLLQLIKQAAVEAVEASKPAAILFGKVSDSAPLSIFVDQKLTLSAEFLVITDKVKSLTVGDKVILLRMQGGQKYIVLDKVVGNE